MSFYLYWVSQKCPGYPQQKVGKSQEFSGTGCLKIVFRKAQKPQGRTREGIIYIGEPQSAAIVHFYIEL